MQCLNNFVIKTQTTPYVYKATLPRWIWYTRYTAILGLKLVNSSEVQGKIQLLTFTECDSVFATNSKVPQMGAEQESLLVRKNV